MKFLAVDPGVKRVGLAVSDADGRLAFPCKTIYRTTRKALFDELLAVMESENIQAVVVGLPLGMEGDETESTRQARNLAASLARRTELPVELMDERCSSLAADEDLAAAGISAKKRKGKMDQQAAVRILQSYLDVHGKETP